MGLWNSHGMEADLAEAYELAFYTLGMNAEEFQLLADYCLCESSAWAEVAEAQKGQDKRKSNLIAKHFRIRARRWKEIAAYAEQEAEKYEGEEKAKELSDRAPKGEPRA